MFNISRCYLVSWSINDITCVKTCTKPFRRACSEDTTRQVCHYAHRKRLLDIEVCCSSITLLSHICTYTCTYLKRERDRGVVFTIEQSEGFHFECIPELIQVTTRHGSARHDTTRYDKPVTLLRISYFLFVSASSVMKFCVWSNTAQISKLSKFEIWQKKKCFFFQVFQSKFWVKFSMILLFIGNVTCVKNTHWKREQKNTLTILRCSVLLTLASCCAPYINQVIPLNMLRNNKHDTLSIVARALSY